VVACARGRLPGAGAPRLPPMRPPADRVGATPDEAGTLSPVTREPQTFLVHDVNFHRVVAASSGNPILAALIEMVSGLYYEQRRKTAERAVQRDRRAAAEAHRRVYQAIRARDADAARRAMHDHLVEASRYQAEEAETDAAREPPRRRRRRVAL